MGIFGAHDQYEHRADLQGVRIARTSAPPSRPARGPRPRSAQQTLGAGSMSWSSARRGPRRSAATRAPGPKHYADSLPAPPSLRPPSSSPRACRRRTWLLELGGPRPGERRGTSAASPRRGSGDPCRFRDQGEPLHPTLAARTGQDVDGEVASQGRHAPLASRVQARQPPRAAATARSATSTELGDPSTAQPPPSCRPNSGCLRSI
jgi:hypothetical protein